MTEGPPKQILLLAPDLLGESLALQLSNEESNTEVFLQKDKLTRHPSLVIWSIENIEMSNTTSIELKRLKEKWSPSPILLIIPAKVSLNPSQILDFECDGILQNPDIKLLKETITTLSSGGRIIRLSDSSNHVTSKKGLFASLSNNLLQNSLDIINKELTKLENVIILSSKNFILLYLTKGRIREIKSARSILIWIWAPIYMSQPENNKSNHNINKTYSTSITIPEKSSKAVWNEIYTRIQEAINLGSDNRTGSIIALQTLSQTKQKLLLSIILSQLDDVINRLKKDIDITTGYIETWTLLEKDIRKHSVRQLLGNYTRLLLDDKNTSISEHLINIIDLNEIDEEMPSPTLMLDSLILDKPILIEGNLLPSDDPRALIKIEILIMNWIIRTGEIICTELISACSDWPELREHLLNPNLISTRELEKLRNQLNSQRRWQYVIQRPIQLYESKRQLLKFANGGIEILLVNEPRDNDLRNLGWWQKQVTLLVEARDAISPQIQYMVKYVGNLMVIILTNVLGRAIGLVGKGIAQGMGRTISR